MSRPIDVKGAERVESQATAIENQVARLFADPKDRNVECLRASERILHDAMQVIATGELTRGKAVEAAKSALERIRPYRIAEARISRTVRGTL